jgi:hypothetical protein
LNRPSSRARLALALGIVLSASAARADAPEVAEANLVESAPAADTITERELAGHLQFLASDLMKGRDTASPEIRIASEYLATRLSMFGYEPMGDEEDGEVGYFAHFPLEFFTPEEEGTELTLTLGDGDDAREIVCRVKEDFLFVPRGQQPGTIEAPLVYAGYGRAGEGDEPNDFDTIDVEGRIVLVLDGQPDGEGDEQRPGRGNAGFGASAFAKLQAARERGALALLVIHPFGLEDARPFAEANPFAARMFGRRSMTLGATSDESVTPLLFVEDRIRDEIDERLALSDSQDAPRMLDDATARFSFEATVEKVRERNVVGMIEGSDDDLKHEVIIFSAHYDHVGVINGEIHNGSDDNGSGTSALIEIAEAFSKAPPPRRTVAFLWVSGEEKGLLGSRWWSENKTLPEGFEIVANINMDMISRNDPDRISITPSRKHPDYSTIIPAAVEALGLEGMEPDFDADQFYARTDSYNFARQGIPIIFFFCGIHEDYHKPGDVFEKADIGKAVRTARAAYRLGWALAEADEAPRVIPEEEEADADADADADEAADDGE